VLFAHKKVYDDAAEYFEEMKKETEEKRAEREEVWAEKELSEKEKEEAAELRYWSSIQGFIFFRITIRLIYTPVSHPCLFIS